MLTKGKKYLKDNDPLYLMAIYSGQETLPELWRKEGASLTKLSEQVAIWSGVEKFTEVEGKLPISIVYPLPKNSGRDVAFREMAESMIGCLQRYAEGLKCTVEDNASKAVSLFNK